MGLTPVADGARVLAMVDDGYTGTSWDSSDGEGGPLGPIYRSTGGDLIGGSPVLEFDAGSIAFAGTPLEGNGQQAWSFSALLRAATPITGRGTLLRNGDSPSLELYCDNGTSVGYSNDGSDNDVAAAVAGVQVLIWTIDPVAGEVKVYRDTGAGLAQIGVTSGDIDLLGYEFQNLSFLGSGPAGANKITGFFLAEFWGHPFLFSAGELTQQASYLADAGGL